MGHSSVSLPFQEDEQNFWGTRPVTETCRQVLTINVMYLLALQREMMDALLNPFRDGVDIFLAELRDVSEALHPSKLVSDLSFRDAVDIFPSAEGYVRR